VKGARRVQHRLSSPSLAAIPRRLAPRTSLPQTEVSPRLGVLPGRRLSSLVKSHIADLLSPAQLRARRHDSVDLLRGPSNRVVFAFAGAPFPVSTSTCSRLPPCPCIADADVWREKTEDWPRKAGAASFAGARRGRVAPTGQATQGALVRASLSPVLVLRPHLGRERAADARTDARWRETENASRLGWFRAFETLSAGLQPNETFLGLRPGSFAGNPLPLWRRLQHF
jgi:hypothetical protein